MYRPIPVLLDHARVASRSVDTCKWFRPISVAVAALDGVEGLDGCQRDLLNGLQDAFRRAGHQFSFEPTDQSDLVITFAAAEEGSSPLSDRIAEPELPAIVTILNRYRLQRLPALLIVVTVDEELRGRSQVEIQELGWLAMARLGSYMILFAKTDNCERPAEYYVFSTLEGGHPEVVPSHSSFGNIRDRLVTQICAKDVDKFPSVQDTVPYDRWQHCRTADWLVAAGRRLGQLGHLDPPVALSRFMSLRRQRQLQSAISWQGQATGALIAFAPGLRVPGVSDGRFTGACVVTCTGKSDVDKTALKRDADLVAVAMRQSRLHAFGTKGRTMKPPSVEAEELAGGMLSAPAVRLSKCPGGYVFDPNGEIVVPRIWAIVHLHRTVEEVMPMVQDGQQRNVVTHILPNFREYPFAVGCGKDLMFDISHDAISRAIKVFNEDDALVAAFFDVPNHGTNFFLFCAPRPGTDIIPEDPFDNLFHLLDPQQDGAVKLTTEIPQI